eukprot:PhM_4_TR2878/c0_g1_i1/m.55092
MSNDLFTQFVADLQNFSSALAPYYGPAGALCSIIDTAGRITLSSRGSLIARSALASHTYSFHTLFRHFAKDCCSSVEGHVGDGVITTLLLASALTTHVCTTWTNRGNNSEGYLRGLRCAVVTVASELCNLLQEFEESSQHFVVPLLDGARRGVVESVLATSVSATCASVLADSVQQLLGGCSRWRTAVERFPNLCLAATTQGTCGGTLDGVVVEATLVSSALPREHTPTVLGRRMLLLDFVSFEFDRNLIVHAESGECESVSSSGEEEGEAITADYDAMAPDEKKRLQDEQWAAFVCALREGGATLILASCAVPHGLVGLLAGAGIAAFGGVPRDTLHQLADMTNSASVPFVPTQRSDVAEFTVPYKSFKAVSLHSGIVTHVALTFSEDYVVETALLVHNPNLQLAREHTQLVLRALRVLGKAAESGVVDGAGCTWTRLYHCMKSHSLPPSAGECVRDVWEGLTASVRSLPLHLSQRRTGIDDTRMRQQYLRCLGCAGVVSYDVDTNSYVCWESSRPAPAVDAWAVYRTALDEALRMLSRALSVDCVS